jgi:hypothetical protein
MPIHADDKLLWIILGGGLLIAARAIPYYLNYINTLTEIHDDESSSKGPCEDAEDALKLSTLEKLVAGPSYKLRASAIKIIAERCTKASTRKLLLQDLASKQPAKRDQALHALWFLLSDSSLRTSPEITQQFISDTSTFTAIVDCLANILPLHASGPSVRADNPTASSPLLPHNRPPSETLALLILRKLLTDQTAGTAFSAGLVSKWLKHYPFPCALPENGARRQDVVKLFKKWGQDDQLMASIMNKITCQAAGLKQLRKYGLTGSSYGEAEIDFGGINDIFMADGEDPANDTPSISSGEAAPRASPSRSRRPPDPASNQAERAVRQRRREAAVYSEGNAPLTQDNIFQRQPSLLGSTPAPAPEPESGPSPELPETAPVTDANLAGMIEQMRRHEEGFGAALEAITAVQNAEAPTSFWQWLAFNSGRAGHRPRPALAEPGADSQRPR